MLTLPSPLEAFPDDEVARTLDQGFDLGRPYGTDAVRRDPEAVQDLLDEAAEDGSFEEGGDEAAFLAAWLRGPRYRFITEAIISQAETVGGRIAIERSIAVGDDAIAAIAGGTCPHLGEFWSFGGSDAHWGHDAAPGSRTLVMTALVDPADVDWVATLRRNANYATGDDESEIALKPGTPVTLTALAVDGAPVAAFARDQRA